MHDKAMKVGFIGCGGFAQGNHIPNAVANPAIKVSAFCDLDENILAMLAETYEHDYVTTDMERIFKDPEIEMVICSTKPDFRLPIMRLAAKHGKHLFVEKPMAFLEEEVVEMVSLMQASKGKFMVGYNRPYSPVYQDLRKYFRKLRKGNTTIIHRIVGEAAIWPKHHYDGVVIHGESTIIHETTHIFDLFNWLTGLAPTRVYTAGGGNMDNIITLSYPDDITAVVISGDNGSVGYKKEWTEINTNGCVLVADHYVELQVVGANVPYVHNIYPYELGDKVYWDGVAALGEHLRTFRSAITPAEIAVGYYYGTQPKVSKGHAEELEYFRRAIRENREPETNVVRGALANLIAWRAVDSWTEGRAINMDFSNLMQS